MPGLREAVGSVSFGSLWKLGPQNSRSVSVFPTVDNHFPPLAVSDMLFF